MEPGSPFVTAGLGFALAGAVFVIIRWDARRSDVSRPRLWAAVAAVPVVIGAYLYVFVPVAPMTGVIMTANTGLVLYGFEREISSEGDDPADPGWLPGEPVGDGETLESEERRSRSNDE